MNYYIDFDGTLYETSKLTKTMLEKIADVISLNSQKDKREILEEMNYNFDSTNGNIYTLAENIAEEFAVNKDVVIEEVKNVLRNGQRFVFEDSQRFLEKIKSNSDNKIILLTFLPKTNQEYQLEKVNGSGLAKYFDTLIFTSELKYTLDLEYNKGIFIDDNPRDLKGLYIMNPLRVIRIRRPENKYSKIELNMENLEEYTSFDEINIDFNK